MEIFETADAMADAILNCENIEETRAAVRILAGFALHDQNVMTSGVTQPGLPNKITLSLLLVSVRNLGKSKGGE